MQPSTANLEDFEIKQEELGCSSNLEFLQVRIENFIFEIRFVTQCWSISLLAKLWALWYAKMYVSYFDMNELFNQQIRDSRQSLKDNPAQVNPKIIQISAKNKKPLIRGFLFSKSFFVKTRTNVTVVRDGLLMNLFEQCSCG